MILQRGRNILLVGTMILGLCHCKKGDNEEQSTSESSKTPVASVSNSNGDTPPLSSAPSKKAVEKVAVTKATPGKGESLPPHETPPLTPVVPPCIEAEAPANVILNSIATKTSSPNVSWTASATGCAITESYEVALGTSLGGNEVRDWIDVGMDLSYQFASLDPVLPHSLDLYLSIRAVDALGNRSASVSAPSWQRAFSPDDISGLALWLDASDIATLHTTQTCDSPVSVDSQKIGCWEDKSGNSNNVIETNISFQPAFDQNGFNGHPAVEFEGSKWLQAAHSVSLDINTNGLTISWVDSPDVIGPTAQYPINKEDQYEVAYQNNHLEAAVKTDSAGVWEWGNFATPAIIGNQQNTFIHDDTTWRAYNNQLLIGSVAPAGGQTGKIKSAATPLTIGGRNIGTAKSYDARMAEIVIYNHALNDTDRIFVEAYFKAKWELE